MIDFVPVSGMMTSHRSVLPLTAALTTTAEETTEMAIHDDYTIARFWAKVEVGPKTVCWEWRGSRHPVGYGTFRVGDTTKRAHVVAYEINSRKAAELNILHRCDNPPCCNPAHLWEGTQLENIDDRTKKGRSSRGVTRPSAKLTEANVIEIRKQIKTGVSNVALASRFDVDASTISNIRHRRKWAWLMEDKINEA